MIMKFPDSGTKNSIVIDEILRFREMDHPYSRILGSMCTVPLQIAKKVYIEFLDTNLGDPKNFEGTKEIENRLIGMIKDLFDAPLNSAGQITSGGSEGNIVSISIAKTLTGKKELIVPDHAHFSFKKISKLMDIRLKPVKTSPTHIVDPKDVKKSLSNDTLAVVAVAGTTELGLIDPIRELSELCHEENVFLHIDAAFGGFVIPFLRELGYDLPELSFSLEGISTISVDAHKMGCSAIPLGILIAREKRWLKEIGVETPYVSTRIQSTLTGTRSGAPVAAAYAVIRALGKEGYMKIVRDCMEVTRYAKQRIEDIGLHLITEPVLNVLGVKIVHLDKVVNMLSQIGWRVNPIPRLSCFRIVVMPHVTKQIIDEFISDLEKVCKRVGEI